MRNLERFFHRVLSDRIRYHAFRPFGSYVELRSGDTFGRGTVLALGREVDACIGSCIPSLIAKHPTAFQDRIFIPTPTFRMAIGDRLFGTIEECQRLPIWIGQVWERNSRHDRRRHPSTMRVAEVLVTSHGKIEARCQIHDSPFSVRLNVEEILLRYTRTFVPRY